MAARATMIAVIVGTIASCGSDNAGVHSQSAARLVQPASGDCRIAYTTLATATEAYVAMTGELPGSESDLVSANLLYAESGDFDLMIGRDEYRLVPISDRCEAFDPSTSSDELAPQTSIGLPDCDVQRRTIEVATEAYNADKGAPPVSESDLVPGYMLVDSVGFDLVAGEIVPVPGICG